MKNLIVDELSISVINESGYDLLSLTDMIKLKEGDFFINDWLRNKNTLDYISIWERMNNPNFNYGEFAIITSGTGRNSFKISVKELVEKCNITCLSSKAGRYGGTYAHKDISFHFAMWLSPEFHLLLVRDYQRLKEDENKRLNSEWDYRRFLSKANYVVHTNSIQRFIVPKITDEEKKKWVYANEADLLNIALFGFTAAQWRNANKDLAKQGLNVRDLADAHELLVLSNLEGLNAILNQQGLENHFKLDLLKKAAQQQLEALRGSTYTIEQIKSPFKQIEESKSKKKTTDELTDKATFGQLLGAVTKAGKPKSEEK